MASLQLLPAELLSHIARYLPHAANLALRLSARYLYLSLAPFQDYKLDDLLCIEQWPCYRQISREARSDDVSAPAMQDPADHNYHACSCCLKIRHPCHFANAMMEGLLSKDAPESDSLFRRSRKCLDCGIKRRLYRSNTEIAYGGPHGGMGFICGHCAAFIQEELPRRMVKRDFHSEVPQSGPCEDCWEKRREGRVAMYTSWLGMDGVEFRGDNPFTYPAQRCDAEIQTPSGERQRQRQRRANVIANFTML